MDAADDARATRELSRSASVEPPPDNTHLCRSRGRSSRPPPPMSGPPTYELLQAARRFDWRFLPNPDLSAPRISVGPMSRCSNARALRDGVDLVCCVGARGASRGGRAVALRPIRARGSSPGRPRTRDGSALPRRVALSRAHASAHNAHVRGGKCSDIGRCEVGSPQSSG